MFCYVLAKCHEPQVASTRKELSPEQIPCSTPRPHTWNVKLDRSHPSQTDDNAKCAMPPVRIPATRRAGRWLPLHIPNKSAHIGRRAGEGLKWTSCIRATNQPQFFSPSYAKIRIFTSLCQSCPASHLGHGQQSETRVPFPVVSRRSQLSAGSSSD